MTHKKLKLLFSPLIFYIKKYTDSSHNAHTNICLLMEMVLRIV